MTEKKDKKTTLSIRCRVDYLSFFFAFFIVGLSSCLVSFLPCMCTFYWSISTWNEVLQKLSLVFVFGGILQTDFQIEVVSSYSLCYSLTSEYGWKVYANELISGEEQVLYWKPTHLALETNALDVGDERVCCWKRERLVLETNAFGTGNELV